MIDRKDKILDVFDEFMLEHFGCEESRADEIPDEEPEFSCYIGMREDGSFYYSDTPDEILERDEVEEMGNTTYEEKIINRSTSSKTE